MKRHLDYTVGDTVYYVGGRHNRFSTIGIGPVESPVVYNEPEGVLIESSIVEVLGHGHDFAYGFFNQLLLDNGNTVKSFHCYDSVESYEKEQEEINSRPKITFDDLVFPKINCMSPKLLAEDITGVQPTPNPFSPLS